MARKVITILTDDLDGGSADRTIDFSLDGVAYAIDLSDQNAGALRKALDVYIDAARRTGRSGIDLDRSTAPVTPAGRSRAQTRAIREWAVENGYQISERGRIPNSVVRAYDNR
ncbi:histone-like nucleoid-structuring protein Lsr2 [Micromonospora sp. NPDC004336]